MQIQTNEIFQDASDKVMIDFKDEKALAKLTQCLLRKDFDLEVNLPPSRLIPTVSSRLNYILFLEDVLITFGLIHGRGIDIGKSLTAS